MTLRSIYRCCLVISATLAVFPRSSDSQRTFEVSISLPSLPTGAGLEVFVDGARVTLVAAALETAPLRVVLLQDITSSVGAGDGIDAPRLSALTDELANLRREDSVQVGAIANRLYLSDTVASPAEVGAGLRTLLQLPAAARLGPSPVWDGVVGAIDMLGRENGRRAIVLVTDGKTTGSQASWKDAVQRALEAETTVCIVAMPSVGAPHDLLGRIASSTGCVAAVARSPVDIRTAVATVVQAIQRFVRLRLSAFSLEPGLHKLDVRTRQDGRVYTREFVSRQEPGQTATDR